MELAKKFDEATSCQLVNIGSLDMCKEYSVVGAKGIYGKFRPRVVLTIRDSEFTTLQTFLPKRYGAVVSDDDTNKMNNNAI